MDTENIPKREKHETTEKMVRKHNGRSVCRCPAGRLYHRTGTVGDTGRGEHRQALDQRLSGGGRFP